MAAGRSLRPISVQATLDRLIRERPMAPRFIFAALSVAFAIAVVFALVTTVRHAPSTRAGVSAMRIG